jgi:hypothetical protein
MHRAGTMSSFGCPSTTTAIRTSRPSVLCPPASSRTSTLIVPFHQARRAKPCNVSLAAATAETRGGDWALSAERSMN